MSLPPSANNAMICSFECTFCRICVEQVLLNVCPNCGGGLVPRPVRPARNWRGHMCLSQYPASAIEKHRSVNTETHKSFAEHIRVLPPEKR